MTAQDMEDMIQAATMAYWKHHREGRPIPSASSAPDKPPRSTSTGRILGRNPRSPLSLDAPLHDGGDLPHEWLAPPTPTGDDTLRLDWLSDEVLEGVLFEARVAAGFSNRCLSRLRTPSRPTSTSSAWPPMATPTPASPSWWAPPKARSGTAGNGFAACWNTCSL